MKNISFLSENFQLEAKFSIYLNRRVFVMLKKVPYRILLLFEKSLFSQHNIGNKDFFLISYFEYWK